LPEVNPQQFDSPMRSKIMTQQHNTKGDLRAAFTNRGLKKAKYSFPIGSTGVFMRVTLAIIYMYLIVISYSLMGTLGLVFVSTSFLIALFSPILYQVGRGFWRKHKVPNGENSQTLKPEVEQES
jgi:ABC-type multidrug transport system fused ATPase/permease subunit